LQDTEKHVRHCFLTWPTASLLFTEEPLARRPAAGRARGSVRSSWWPFACRCPPNESVNAFTAALDEAGVALGPGLNFSPGTWPARLRTAIDPGSQPGVPRTTRRGGRHRLERLAARFNALYGNRGDGVDRRPRTSWRRRASGWGGWEKRPCPPSAARDDRAGERDEALIRCAPPRGRGGRGPAARTRAPPTSATLRLYPGSKRRHLDAAIAMRRGYVAHVADADAPGRAAGSAADLDRYLADWPTEGYRGWVAWSTAHRGRPRRDWAWLPRARRQRVGQASSAPPEQKKEQRCAQGWFMD